MLENLFGSTSATLVLTIVGIIIILSVILSMWKKVPQDKALVITGLKKRVITGGGGLQIPVLERGDYISLGNMQLDVVTEESMSSQGVPIKVVSTAVIKVRNDRESILSSIEQFNGRNAEAIEQSIRETAINVLEGKLREIISTMSVEEIYSSREKFGSTVQEVAGSELGTMGLEIKIFTIKDIADRNGYIESLGVKQISEKKKEADIAKAEAEKERQISVSLAKRDGEAARIKSETEVAEKQKEQEVQKSEFLKQQQTAKAIADASYSIQQNITLKEVTSAEMDAEVLKQQRLKEVESEKVQIKIVQELKNKELAEVQAQRNKAQLQADVLEPALAEKERQKAQADAKKYAKIAEAEAEAEAKKAQADADAEVIKKTGMAQAEVIRQTGLAEAEATKIKGLAEAEAMEKKAEAYKKYNGAAMANMLIEILPEMAGKIAEPLSRIEKIVVLDGGSNDGQNGVGNVASNVTGVMSQVMESVKEVTGIDISDVIKGNTYDAKVNRNITVNGLGDSSEKAKEVVTAVAIDDIE